MSDINKMIGLVRSKLYLKDLEKLLKEYNINESPMFEKLDDLERYQNDFFDNIASRFKNLKNYKIDDEIKKEAYFKSVSGDSSRTRPLLLFLGSLCKNQKVDKQILLNCGMSIEMIHKMSLILDDYFDNDPTRKGHATFHTIYDERVIIEIAKLLLNLSNVIFFNSISNYDEQTQKKLNWLYKQIIFDMGNGFILDLDKKDKFVSIEDAYIINDLQSSTILKNSLLIGYSLSNGGIEDCNYSLLSYIGSNMGRIFQSFNDIKNFVNEEEQLKDKSVLYTDLKENRKNIVLARVPKELFYEPYVDEDIIAYIKDNNLPQLIIEELSLNLANVKDKIENLSDSIGKDTMMMITNIVSKKTLSKLKTKS